MGEGDGSGLSRRRVLAAGAGLAAGIGLAGAAVATGTLPAVALLRSVAASGVSPATAGAHVRVEWLHSTARRREVQLVTITPTAAQPVGLPVCVALHGRNGDATAVAAGGLPGLLSAAAARRAVRPFAVVAVDGGNSYWHQHRLGDDPMGLLLDELPSWLVDRGLQPTPFAAAGISMGGFGALHYARMRQARGAALGAVAVIAPALLTSWAEMHKREAFHSASDWGSYDPLLNLPALGRVPVGLWCGTEDTFVEGARRFAATGRPEVASFGPGGHNDGYYRKALPEVLRFIGRHRP